MYFHPRLRLLTLKIKVDPYIRRENYWPALKTYSLTALLLPLLSYHGTSSSPVTVLVAAQQRALKLV